MIAAKENFPTLTPNEYFAWEEGQNSRHEYIGGKVYAMSGGTINHSEIAGNLLAMLKTHLRGSGCKTLNSDARVNIQGSNDYVYPELSVTCDARDQATAQFITYPCLIKPRPFQQLETSRRKNDSFGRGCGLIEGKVLLKLLAAQRLRQLQPFSTQDLQWFSFYSQPDRCIGIEAADGVEHLRQSPFHGGTAASGGKPFGQIQMNSIRFNLHTPQLGGFGDGGHGCRIGGTCQQLLHRCLDCQPGIAAGIEVDWAGDQFDAIAHGFEPVNLKGFRVST